MIFLCKRHGGDSPGLQFHCVRQDIRSVTAVTSVMRSVDVGWIVVRRSNFRESVMRISVLAAVAGAICLSLFSMPANAQASRTWISGVGDDANPCSRTAPCKTWAGAISKTADCGEIDALDPGGFGTVTITKGIKLDGGGGEGGQVASILASGVPGITINNTSVNCPFVVIRNLDINGVHSGTTGINVVNGGQVSLENVDIENFTQWCFDTSSASGAVSLVMYNTNLERCG